MSTRLPRRSALALAVLVMLHEAPLHPYRMQQLIKERSKDSIINVEIRSSLYKTIDRLHRDGLIAVQGTARDGARPERTTYELTEAGRETWRRWLKESLSTIRTEYPEFPAAISLAAALDPAEALEQLRTRRTALQERLAGLEDSLERFRGVLPRVTQLESEYLDAVVGAELSWIDGVIDDLAESRLTWDFDELLEFAARWNPGD